MRILLAGGLLLVGAVSPWVQAATEERVVIESDGWELVGDWRRPEREGPFPAALLLHRAAGSRAEYVELAEQMTPWQLHRRNRAHP